MLMAKCILGNHSQNMTAGAWEWGPEETAKVRMQRLFLKRPGREGGWRGAPPDRGYGFSWLIPGTSSEAFPCCLLKKGPPHPLCFTQHYRSWAESHFFYCLVVTCVFYSSVCFICHYLSFVYASVPFPLGSPSKSQSARGSWCLVNVECSSK